MPLSLDKFREERSGLLVAVDLVTAAESGRTPSTSLEEYRASLREKIEHFFPQLSVAVSEAERTGKPCDPLITQMHTSLTQLIESIRQWEEGRQPYHPGILSAFRGQITGSIIRNLMQGTCEK